jgi:hypothetical protein
LSFKQAYLLVLAEIISSALKMEAICSSEMWVATQQTTRGHIPEDDTLHNHHCENLKSYTVNFLFVRLKILFSHLADLFLSGSEVILVSSVNATSANSSSSNSNDNGSNKHLKRSELELAL